MHCKRVSWIANCDYSDKILSGLLTSVQVVRLLQGQAMLFRLYYPGDQECFYLVIQSILDLNLLFLAGTVCEYLSKSAHVVVARVVMARLLMLLGHTLHITLHYSLDYITPNSKYYSMLFLFI